MERALHGASVASWRHVMPRGVVYFQSAMLSALLIYLCFHRRCGNLSQFNTGYAVAWSNVHDWLQKDTSQTKQSENIDVMTLKGITPVCVAFIEA